MTKTAEELREEARQCRVASQESFDRCDTDGFLSQWCHDKTAQKKEMEADLIEAGNQSIFPGLFQNQRRIRAKLISTRYGQCWAIVDASGQFTGRFIGTSLKALTKAGLEEREEIAPAKIKSCGDLVTLNYYVARADRGYPIDAVEYKEV